MSKVKNTPAMHPNNCMVDCDSDSCTCTPTRQELKLLDMMERMAFCSCGWTAEDFQRYARAAVKKARGES